MKKILISSLLFFCMSLCSCDPQEYWYFDYELNSNEINKVELIDYENNESAFIYFNFKNHEDKIIAFDFSKIDVISELDKNYYGTFCKYLSQSKITLHWNHYNSIANGEAIVIYYDDSVIVISCVKNKYECIKYDYSGKCISYIGNFDDLDNLNSIKLLFY